MYYEFYALTFNGSIEKNIQDLRTQFSDFLDYGSCFCLPVHLPLGTRPSFEKMTALRFPEIKMLDNWLYLEVNKSILEKNHTLPYPDFQGIPIGRILPIQQHSSAVLIEDMQTFYSSQPLNKMTIKGMALNTVKLETWDSIEWYHACSFEMEKLRGIKLKS